MRVIDNPNYKRSTALRAKGGRSLRALGAGALQALIRMWNIAFPMPPLPRGPDDPSPIAEATALREPALLSEHLDAEEAKRVG